MSLTEYERRCLAGLADDLEKHDPRLAEALTAPPVPIRGPGRGRRSFRLRRPQGQVIWLLITIAALSATLIVAGASLGHPPLAVLGVIMLWGDLALLLALALLPRRAGNR